MLPDSELEARLDAALAAERPRPGFETELWARMMAGAGGASPRAGGRHRGRWSALAGVAAVLVVGLALVQLARAPLGVPTPGTGAARGSDAARAPAGAAGSALSPNQAGPWGTLPRPRSLGGPAATGGFTGRLPALPALLPVYRWADPEPADAARMAQQAGVTASPSPPGTFSSGSVTVTVLPGSRSTREPLVVVVDRAAAPPPGAPDQLRQAADSVLATLGLTPGWPATVQTGSAGGVVTVRYIHLFEAQPGVQVPQVDPGGQPLGTQVGYSSGGRSVVAPAPVGLDRGLYPTASAGALTAALPGGAEGASMTRAELVYVAVPAGNGTGYFEPAIRFSGDGPGGTERVALVPAIDPGRLG